MTFDLAAEQTYTPTELNRAVRGELESRFASIWVEGEASDVFLARSGHTYFTLKDASAQIKAAFFRHRNPSGRIRIVNGDQIRVLGKLSLYEPRGDYQLIVDRVVAAGVGDALKQIEQLKQRLKAEGLFDPQRKRPLPGFPRRIAVVTSPRGAAIADVMHVMEKRYPQIELVVVPATVQGVSAVDDLVSAVQRADRLKPDVILLTRGGGSTEDLMAFNDERLARAVAASDCPIACAVGHETDWCIAEFVADLRAATPSAAAAALVPDGPELRLHSRRLSRRLLGSVTRALTTREQQVDRLSRSLTVHGPRRRLDDKGERLARLNARIKTLIDQDIAGHRTLLERMSIRLARLHPLRRWTAATEQRERLDLRLTRSMSQQVSRAQQNFWNLAARLDQRHVARRVTIGEERLTQIRKRLGLAMSNHINARYSRALGARRTLDALGPDRVLARGFAVVRDQSGAVVRKTSELAPGQTICTQLVDGRFESEVKSADC